MKKVLSLVLAFAMILGSFGFVFANQYPDVKDTEYYSESVNVLSGLGVVGGFPDGTFQPTGKITRAQMAVMLINALGIPVSGKADTPFSDVPAAHWASGYIKYAANMGYVAGYTDGSFKPDKEVSYDEALTMIVAALGYTSEGLTGNWPGNFVNAARGLGILSICKTTGSAPATRADVCCFLYKALTSPIGRTNKDGEFIKTVIGKVNGNDVYDTMIDRLGALDYDPGTGAGDEFVVMGDEDSQVNLGEYLGACITAYANEDGEIIAIKEVKSIFIEDTVKNIKKNYSKTADWTVDAPYFKNGEDANTDKAIDDFGNTDTIKIAVSVKSKEIKELYSIQTWNLTEADFASEDVQEIIKEDHKLLNSEFAEDDDEEIDMNSFVLLGRDSLADIVEDDVVYVYVGPDSGKITKVEIGTETVEGKISKMPSSKDAITVDGKSYDISESALIAGEGNDMHGYMTGKKACTFYLDYAGDVYHAELNKDATSDDYGILVNFWDEVVKGKISYYVEIFLPDGTSKEFQCDEDEHGKPLYESCDYGDLVKFTTNSKNVVTALDNNYAGPSDLEVSKNGVADGKKITSDTVAFEYSGADFSDDELRDVDNYKAVSASSLFGTKLSDVIFMIDGSNIPALSTTGSAGTEGAEIAFVVEEGDETPEGKMYTVLYEGKSQDLNFEVAVGVDSFYTLTINEDGVVTAVKPYSFPAPDFSVDLSDANGSVTYSGNIFTDANKNSYDMDADIVVYVKNADDEWSVGSKSALKGKNTKFDSIVFKQTDDDGDYDIVIVDQK